MKNYLITLLGGLLFWGTTQAQINMYTAAKAGLNLREKPDAGSPVLVKIPYGEKVTRLDGTYYGSMLTEGMHANWFYVSYGSVKGYAANVYLFPVPPPAESVKDLRSYLDAIGKPVATWHKKSGDEESVEEVDKITYDNGISFRHTGQYESHSETASLPFFSTYQAFVLARLLSPNPELLKQNDAYPQKAVSSANGGRDILIMNRYATINGRNDIIYIVLCDGGCLSFEIVAEDGETFFTISSWV